MSETIYILIAIALAPYFTCFTCEYPKYLIQNHKRECADFLSISLKSQRAIKLFDHKKRYPKSKHIPFFAYLPILGFCYGIFTPDKKKQYYFLSLEIVIIAIAGFASMPYKLLYLSLLGMAAIDFRSKMLPDTLVLPTMWLGLILSTMSLTVSHTDAIWGAVLGYSIPWIIAKACKYITKKDGMGYGDFKMIAMLGAWLGPIKLTFCVFIASCLFIMVFITLAYIKKINTRTPVAFGPFLATATVITLNSKIAVL